MTYHFKIKKLVLATVIDKYKVEADSYEEAQETMLHEFNFNTGANFVESITEPIDEDNTLEPDEINGNATRSLIFNDNTIITTNADIGIY